MMNVKHALSFLACVLLLASPLHSQQWGNYTLVAVQGQSTAKLIDTTSATYHTYTPGSGSTGYSSYVLPGGDWIRSVSVSNSTFTGGGMTGGLQRVNWNNQVVWSYTYSTSQYCMHHDFCVMPNGNILLIAYELKTAAEVTQAGSATSHIMWPDKIVEIQPTGTNGANIVWEWHAWDHLVQNVDATKDNYGVVAEHPELLNINFNNTTNTKDWMHANGIDYNPMLDQIVLSSHNLNEFYVIDHSTTTAEAAGHSGGNSGKGGDILYRWGNPAAYGTTGTNVLHVVHDAHWVPEGTAQYAGYLVGYNNNGISNNQSCVDFVQAPYDGSYNYNHTSGQAYTPASYSYRLACNGHNSNMGNSQQLPNGNNLVCIAQSGTIYETNPAGTSIWTYTASGNVAQAFRYEECYLTTTRPDVPTITQNGNALSSSSASSYQWYLNGTAISGATNQSYTPTQNGVYVVKVGEATGCVFNYSTGFAFTSVITGLENTRIASLKLAPNPASGSVRVLGIPENEIAGVQLMNISGASISTPFVNQTLSLEGISNGIYLVQVNLKNGTRQTLKLSITNN